VAIDERTDAVAFLLARILYPRHRKR
jgi:hypothetical protein